MAEEVEKKALVFFINEWDGRKSHDELVKVMDVTLDGGIINDLVKGIVDDELVKALTEKLRTPAFAKFFLQYVKDLYPKMTVEKDIMKRLKACQYLVYLFFKADKLNKAKEVLNDYLKITLELMKFNDVFTVYVYKKMSGQKINDMNDEDLKLLGGFIHIDNPLELKNLFGRMIDKID